MDCGASHHLGHEEMMANLYRLVMLGMHCILLSDSTLPELTLFCDLRKTKVGEDSQKTFCCYYIMEKKLGVPGWLSW